MSRMRLSVFAKHFLSVSMISRDKERVPGLFACFVNDANGFIRGFDTLDGSVIDTRLSRLMSKRIHVQPCLEAQSCT